MTCRHCNGRKANRPRGLCWGCYYGPGVRELYPVTSKFANRKSRGLPAEPTEAELDAMIEERRKTMPET